MLTQLSLLTLFTEASWVVQLVMATLLLMSLLSWSFIFQKAIFFRRSERTMDDFEFTFWSGIDLNKLYEKMSQKEEPLTGQEALFVAGFKEYLRLKHLKSEVIPAADRIMKIKLSKEIEDLEYRLPFLATVQSISPYIGLFGTVWGIMHAFKGLGALQQMSLTAVIPGIAEALIATAMGLLAAIPAGIAYNRYVVRSERLSRRYNVFIEELIMIIQRQLCLAGKQPAPVYNEAVTNEHEI